MKYIKDKSGIIVLAFDSGNFYYNSQEPKDELAFDKSISIE